MRAHLTTDVVLSQDGHDLILSGPRTGMLALHFEQPDDGRALHELFEKARGRCLEAHLDGQPTNVILGEIITLTEIAMEAADRVTRDDARAAHAQHRAPKLEARHARHSRNA